jgi:hypothetical protein
MSMDVHYLEGGSQVRERKSVVIDREFERIHEVHGKITQEVVIEEARNPESPLHPYFEWDDSRAAQKYREAQALQLMLASKMVAYLNQETSHEHIRVRRWLSPFRGEGFRMRLDVLKDAEMRRAQITRKISQLKSWADSVVDMTEFDHLRGLILAEINLLEAKLEEEETAA